MSTKDNTPEVVNGHYWPLWCHMSETHGLTLLDSECEDIVQAVKAMGRTDCTEPDRSSCRRHCQDFCNEAENTPVMLSTMFSALLIKHKVIDQAAMDDPEGYDKGNTARGILLAVHDLLDFLRGDVDETPTPEVPK